MVKWLGIFAIVPPVREPQPFVSTNQRIVLVDYGLRFGLCCCDIGSFSSHLASIFMRSGVFLCRGSWEQAGLGRKKKRGGMAETK